MWRWVHAVGWLVGLGIAGWVAGLLGAGAWQRAGGDADAVVVPFAVVGVALGLLAAALLSRVSWGHPRADRWLALGGGAVVLLGCVAGGMLFLWGLAVDYGDPELPLAGLGFVLLGMLAFSVAAVGAGLLLAGVAGVVAHRHDRSGC